MKCVRPLLGIVAYVSSGCALNTLAAWSFAACGIGAVPESFVFSSRGGSVASWPSSVPGDWPLRPDFCDTLPRFGRTFIIAGMVGDVHYVIVDQYGWPWRSLECVQRLSESGVGPGNLWFGAGRPVPLAPVWPGFGGGIVFFAACTWAIVCAPPALARRLRILRNQCPRCGYPVSRAGACSECGTEVQFGKRRGQRVT